MIKKEDLKNFPLIPYVSLHMHSHYSSFDGVAFVPEYVQKAKEYNHPAVALTEHGNFNSSFELQECCQKNGLKHLVGIEIYLSHQLYNIKSSHLTILLKNNQGFKALNKQIYNNYYHFQKKEINYETLLDISDIVVLTGCIDSIIAQLFFQNQHELAETCFLQLKEKFGNDLYAEIMLNELEEQKKYNQFIIQLAQKHKTKIVVTTDAHYVDVDDAKLQDVLLAIQTKSVVGTKFKFQTRHNFYANSQHLFYFNEKFKYNYDAQFLISCIENTLEVTEKLNFSYDTEILKYPQYIIGPEDQAKYNTTNKNQLLSFIITDRLNTLIKQKYFKTKQEINKYVERVKYELSVIQKKQMVDYFLINYDIVRHYKSLGYFTSAGRGSAAGCLLSFLLGITSIDPIKHDLYFERFLNPARNSPPDIDIDYISGTEHEVIKYIEQKYGQHNVVKVGVYQTLNEKSAIKDVNRALYGKDNSRYDSEVFQLTKYITKETLKNKTLIEWTNYVVKNNLVPAHIKKYLTNHRIVIEIASRLIGKIRNIGQHAGGVVITDEPVYHLLPVNFISTTKKIVTAFTESDLSDKTLSKLKILKLDILKLHVLKVFYDVIQDVKKDKNQDISPQLLNVDINDSNIYKEIDDFMAGIFQFESAGIKTLLHDMRANCFQDLVAANALYRPGPLKLNAHKEYIKNKQSIVKKSILPELDNILKETNGVLLYQEQIMFIVNFFGNFSLYEGDLLRRSLEKCANIFDKLQNNIPLTEEEQADEDYKKVQCYFQKLATVMQEKGYTSQQIQHLINLLQKFSGYSFNKSHCVSYSYIACQTLFLKHYFPLYFYASLLNNPKQKNTPEALNMWLGQVFMAIFSKNIEIEFYNDDITWTCCVKNNKIKLGLNLIKGLGEKSIMKLQKFLNTEQVSLYHIMSNQFKTIINKKQFKLLLDLGVFDHLCPSRAYINYVYENKQIIDFNESLFPATSEQEKKDTLISILHINIFLIQQLVYKFKEYKKKYQKVKILQDSIHYSTYYICYIIKIENNKIVIGNGIKTFTISTQHPINKNFENTIACVYIKNEKAYEVFI